VDREDIGRHWGGIEGEEDSLCHLKAGDVLNIKTTDAGNLNFESEKEGNSKSV
jgi:hypothetical protein